MASHQPLLPGGDKLVPLPDPKGQFQLETKRNSSECKYDGESPRHHRVSDTVLSLKEICCRTVGQSIPFERVQLHPEPVPGFLQSRICYWSFPSNEAAFLKYVRMLGVTRETLREAERCEVTEITQTGMHVAATVVSSKSSTERPPVYTSMEVYVLADRGRITTAKCSCGGSTWCEHIVALCLARIRGCVPLRLSPPISERLRDFSREKLQKLLQYFVERIPLQGVLVAQEIIATLEDEQSEMSNLPGAPDITAGGGTSDVHMWLVDRDTLFCHLDDTFTKVFPLGDTPMKRFHPDALLWSLLHFKQIEEDGVCIIDTLLKDHDDTIATILEWALDKLNTMSRMESSCLGYRGRWSLWCLSRMISSVLNIFMVDPLMNPSSKSCVLDKLLGSTPAVPEAEYVHNALHVCMYLNNKIPVEDRLAALIQALPEIEAAKSHNRCCYGDRISFEANCVHYLHCIMSILDYMQHHELLGSGTTSELLVTVCEFIFPGTADISNCTSLQDYSLLNPALDRLDSCVLLDHVLLLMECLVLAGSPDDCVTKLTFSIFGKYCLAPSVSSSPAPEVFCDWVERKLCSIALSHLGEDAEPSKTVEVVSKLTIDYLQEVDFSALQQGRLFAVFNLMILLLGHRMHLDTCADLIQNKIFYTVYSISEPSQGPSYETLTEVALLGDAFQRLLHDAFTLLPNHHGDTLFDTLESVYPWPLPAAVCLELLTTQNRKTKRSTGNDLSTSTLRGLIFPHVNSNTKLSCPDYIASSSKQLDFTKHVDIAQSISDIHVSFLSNLAQSLSQSESGKCLLFFKLHLLAMRVHNCRMLLWVGNDVSYSSEYMESCLAICSKMSSSVKLQAMDILGHLNTFMFCLAPKYTLSLLAHLSEACDLHKTNSTLGSILLYLLKLHHDLSLVDILKSVNMIAELDPPTLAEAVHYVLSIADQLRIISDLDNDAFEMTLANTLGKGYSQYKYLKLMEHPMTEIDRDLWVLQHKALSILGLVQSEKVIGNERKFQSLASPRYRLLSVIQDTACNCHNLIELVCDSQMSLIREFIELMQFVLCGQLNEDQFCQLLKGIGSYLSRDASVLDVPLVASFADAQLAEVKSAAMKGISSSSGGFRAALVPLETAKKRFYSLGLHAEFRQFCVEMSLLCSSELWNKLEKRLELLY